MGEICEIKVTQCLTIIRGKREAIQQILESHRGNERADSHMTVRTSEGGIAVFTAMKVFPFFETSDKRILSLKIGYQLWCH